MAVIVWAEREFPDGQKHVVQAFLPTGRQISKEERAMAERLDALLEERMPKIDHELRELGLAKNAMAKWHALGRRLQFVDDPELVSPQDRDSGLVWLAMRQHCPDGLLPRGEIRLTPQRARLVLDGTEAVRRVGKRHDHLERCYKLGKLDLADVDWITWSDYDSFLESPGLERDARILPLMRAQARHVGRKLTRAEFRSVCRALRDEIPTKQNRRDTSGLSEDRVMKLVERAFKPLIPD